MKKTLRTETAIENLVIVRRGQNSNAREAHVYREALRGLVRLAKSEQTAKMKMDIDRVTGAAPAHPGRHRAKAMGAGQSGMSAAGPGQQHLELDQS